MELIPTRSWFPPGEPVVVELEPAPEADLDVVVTRLGQEVLRTLAVAGTTRVELGALPRGGYSLRAGGARGAVDVLDSAFERPRYGFATRFVGPVDLDRLVRAFRRRHLNAIQLYDWSYRHSELMPPTERYRDPLGQERDLGVVNDLSSRCSAVGIVPLGYSAVYAIGHDETAQWRGEILYGGDGRPYRLGEEFLVLVDPAAPAWLEHYLAQLEAVVERTAIEGFHLDQYGWPKFARRGDGVIVDLADSFVALLDAVRERLPDTPVIFNNVNDFPTHATASSPQSASYIEVWDPHSGLQDLGRLALRTRALRAEHPPILSAYLSCLAEDEARGMNAAELVMATAWSHGASHLLLGEERAALTGPYYPDHLVLSPASADVFDRWYDVQVAWGDLLYDPGQVDVTEFYTGGINQDIVVRGPSTSTSAEPATLWTRVVRTSHGVVVHLINLVGQSETGWDRGKEPVEVVSGATIEVGFLEAGSEIRVASVEDPEFRRLAAAGQTDGRQVDALSAGQGAVSFALPDLGVWTVLLIPTPT